MSYPHMAIPHLKAVVNGFYMTDGGSIDLRILDDAGLEHSLELVQHLIPENSTADRRFGRLYLDDRLIDIRSVDEAAIITFLETAAIQVPYAKSSPAERRHVIIGIDIKAVFDASDKGPVSALGYLVKQLLSFVGSEEYVRLASSAASGD